MVHDLCRGGKKDSAENVPHVLPVLTRLQKMNPPFHETGQKYVTHTEAGEGLIFYGNVVLPFVDRFPKDTELYRVMTTKPEEVGEA